jgi:hypothetical protein
MSAVYEFKSLDWLKNIVQTDHNLKKKHVNPTAAFDFEDDFSVGTIHGKNDDIHTRKVGIDMRPQSSASPPPLPPPERQGLHPSQ